MGQEVGCIMGVERKECLDNGSMRLGYGIWVVDFIMHIVAEVSLCGYAVRLDMRSRLW